MEKITIIILLLMFVLNCCSASIEVHDGDGHEHEGHHEEKHKEIPAMAFCNVSRYSGSTNENITGMIYLTQIDEGLIQINVSLTGFNTAGASKRGFHVHANGKISDSCIDAGSHFNPTNQNHSAPDSETRHCGDLGNIEPIDGEVNHLFNDSVIKITGKDPCMVVGKSIVIHEGEDDLGTKANDEGSRTTGNAGSRMACCIIMKAEEKSISNKLMPIHFGLLIFAISISITRFN